MDAGSFASKTLGWEDLAQPEVVRVAGELRRFALRLAFAGTPFAVNGVLRHRFWVRRHKLWEYARGVACVMKSMEAREVEEAKEGAGSFVQRQWRVSFRSTIPKPEPLPNSMARVREPPWGNVPPISSSSS